MLRDEKWEELGNMYAMLRLCVPQDGGVIERFAEKLGSYIDKCVLDGL